MKHILITGVPGIGKTTLVKKLVTLLQASHLNLDGFFTEEKRNDRGQRMGFNIRVIHKNTCITLADKLKHPDNSDTRTLGQYTVYVKNFEDSVLQLITTFDKGILIIDEIGKMELFSKRFQHAVSDLFKKKNIRILATVPIRGPPFVESLKKDTGCHLFTVTNANRDLLVNQIADLLINNK